MSDIIQKPGLEASPGRTPLDEVRQALAAIGITLPEDNLKQDPNDTPDPV